MRVGTLVRANSIPEAQGLNFPKCFGIVTKVHRNGQIMYVQWIDSVYNNPRPIHMVYLEVLCK